MASNGSGNIEKARTKTSVFSKVPKKVFWIVLGVLILAGIGVGTYLVLKSAKASSTTTTAAALQTSTARQGDLVLEASGTGYLVAASESAVGFSTSGKLANLYVKLGDTVEAGQLLAELDDSSQQLALANAQQTLRELTSASAIATAQQTVASAEATLYNAQVALNTLKAGTSAALLQNAQVAWIKRRLLTTKYPACPRIRPNGPMPISGCTVPSRLSRRINITWNCTQPNRTSGHWMPLKLPLHWPRQS